MQPGYCYTASILWKWLVLRKSPTALFTHTCNRIWRLINPNHKSEKATRLANGSIPVALVVSNFLGKTSSTWRVLIFDNFLHNIFKKSRHRSRTHQAKTSLCFSAHTFVIPLLYISYLLLDPITNVLYSNCAIPHQHHVQAF